MLIELRNIKLLSHIQTLTQVNVAQQSTVSGGISSFNLCNSKLIVLYSLIPVWNVNKFDLKYDLHLWSGLPDLSLLYSCNHLKQKTSKEQVYQWGWCLSYSMIISFHSIRLKLYYHVSWGLLSWWNCGLLQTPLWKMEGISTNNPDCTRCLCHYVSCWWHYCSCYSDYTCLLPP